MLFHLHKGPCVGLIIETESSMVGAGAEGRRGGECVFDGDRMVLKMDGDDGYTTG